MAMAGIYIGIERPPLVAALAARGVPIWSASVRDAPDAVVVAMASDWVSDWAGAAKGVPAFVLTRDAAEAAAAIDAGADDAAPHWTADILIAARLAAWLRRDPARVRVGGLTIDPVTRRASRDGRSLALHPREYDLLLHLARNAGRVVGQRELLAQVWGLGFDPGTNVIQVHVSRLRAKLDHGFARPMLITQKRVGYCLVAAGG